MKLLCLLALCTVVFSKPTADDFADYAKFKAKYGKAYNGPEDRERFEIFLKNKRLVEQHNKAGKGFTVKLNHLSDMKPEEYQQLLAYKGKSKAGATFLSPSNVQLPAEVDWRKKGYVTPVKDQGQCGSCWAFSATGSLEGQHFKKTGKLVSLSEQNLVDCSGKWGNDGCNGGLMDQAFDYIKDNKGIDTEKSYPYEAQDRKCRFKKANVGATLTGYVDIESGSEKKLQEAVATVGPVSVAIDASHWSFQTYDHGVYDEPMCSSSRLDHGVLCVGYGTSTDGKKYWIIKNSWNTDWGMDGYMWMARNKQNMCGVATMASYPTV
jgi:cathepsin L